MQHAAQNYMKGVGGSVADPDDFLPDPDPTFENIRKQILTVIHFQPSFFLIIFLAELCSKKYIHEPKS
jgi:hypothetical protein